MRGSVHRAPDSAPLSLPCQRYRPCLRYFRSSLQYTAIVQAKGLAQVSDSGAIEQAVAQVLADNAAMAADYLSGKDKLFGALMGMVMKALKGQGNPQIVKDELTRQLAAMKP